MRQVKREATQSEVAEPTGQRNWLAKLEIIGDHYLIERLPWQLPLGGRKTVVTLLPWIVAGLLLMSLPWVFLALTIGSTIGVLGSVGGSSFRPLYYLSVLALLTEVIIGAKALSGLYNRELRGWRLLFYAVLVHFVFAVLRFIAEPRAYYSLIWSILITLAALTLVFQVKREYS